MGTHVASPEKGDRAHSAESARPSGDSLRAIDTISAPFRVSEGI